MAFLSIRWLMTVERSRPLRAPALRQSGGSQRRALSLAEDIQEHALTFTRPEEPVPHPVRLVPDRTEVDFRGRQLEGRVRLVQIIDQTP